MFYRLHISCRVTSHCDSHFTLPVTATDMSQGAKPPKYRLDPTRSLRSSSTHQLSVPRHNLTFGSRAFRFSAPGVWNSLPVSIRESQSLPTFRRHLKTLYFQSAYPLQLPALPITSSSAHSDSSTTLAL